MPGKFSWRRPAALCALVLGLSAVTAVPATAETGHAKASGCGQPAARPGTTTVEQLRSGGLDREYRLHVPASYDPQRPYPVVLSFHGHGRTAEYQEQLSEFSSADVISVYPQGVTGTDGESAWFGAPYSAPGVDDVAFTGDLIDTVEQSLCVDPHRIYAAGKSNGGGFVGVLACRLGDRIAAFAPVSGAFYPQGGDCTPSHPVPVLDFHGTADTTIPYTGNPAKGLPSIPDWLDAWAARDRCAGGPVESEPVSGVVKQKWYGCALEHYRVEGAGHVWPSTHPNNDSQTPTNIDATPVILRFFAAHRLR